MAIGDHFNYWASKIGGNAKGADAAQLRILHQKADALLQSGRGDEAVDLLVGAGDPGRAAALAQKAGLWKRAGELHEAQNKTLDAARAFERAQEWDRAGKLFEKAGDQRGAEGCYKKAGGQALKSFLERKGDWVAAAKVSEETGDRAGAAACYEKAKDLDSAERCLRAENRLLDIAELFNRNGRPDRAGKIYEEAGLPTKASEAYSAGNCHLDALRILDPMARAAIAQSRHAPVKMQEDARALARRAATHALALGEKQVAAELLERAGDLARAAECYLAIQPKKAAELFEKAGDRARAAAAREAAGDAAGAELLRAKEADPRRAAELLAERGQHGEAAALFAKHGMMQESAKELIAAGKHLSAAQLLHAQGDLPAAAEAYEGAGVFEQAERLFRHTGNDDGLIRLYTRRGDQRELARIHIRRKNLDAAVRALQSTDQDAEAVALLAHCFRELGMAPQALLKFEELVKQNALKPETPALYYEYARLLEEQGRKAEAIAAYNAILAVSLDFGDVVQRIKKLEKPEPAAPPVAPAPPERFEVIEEIGRGGQGVVWKARDRLLDRTVALKSIHDASGNKALLREARSMAALVHPNIVTLHEIFEKGETFYMVMEFLEGETLQKWTRRGEPLPAHGVIHVAKGVVAALAYAHGKGLIHRDIKPSNIMLLEDGAVKVLDFGLATTVENAERSSTQCGTPYYMAPEQILCRRPDARTDLYALGVTLYQALTGRAPFHGGDIFFQHLNCQPAPVRSYAPDVPMKLDVLILQCLEKDPQYRPESAGAILEQLQSM
jgi:tetratricopeptide (TPR) repeat protein